MPFNRPIPDSKPHAKLSSGVGAIVEAEKLMQIALLLPSAAVIGWLIGAWLDHKLHQSWIAIAGIVFGCISGLVYVIRMADGCRAGFQNRKRRQLKPRRREASTSNHERTRACQSSISALAQLKRCFGGPSATRSF